MVMVTGAFANVNEFRKTDPEFAEFFGNFAGVEVPGVSKLDTRTRYMAIVAALMGCQGVDEFKAVLPEALEAGLTPSEVKEIIYQGTAYSGIGRTRPFLTSANEIFTFCYISAQGGCEPQLIAHANGE